MLNIQKKKNDGTYAFWVYFKTAYNKDFLSYNSYRFQKKSNLNLQIVKK